MTRDHTIPSPPPFEEFLEELKKNKWYPLAETTNLSHFRRVMDGNNPTVKPEELGASLRALYDAVHGKNIRYIPSRQAALAKMLRPPELQ